MPKKRTPLALASTLALAALLNAPAYAQPLKPALADLSFLVGTWSATRSHVADTAGTATGNSTIALAAGGAILVRRDHTNLFDAKGHAAGGFDQLMTIYPDGGAIHADYFDPAHVIHYTSAAVQPGHSVVFSTALVPGAPAFRLSYTLTAPGTLAVAFAMAPPPGNNFHEIASGIVTKDR